MGGSSKSMILPFNMPPVTNSGMLGMLSAGATGYPDGLCTDANGSPTNITVNTSDEKLGDGCYSFNGSSSSIEISNTLAGSTFTISCWINSDSIGSNQSAFSNVAPSSNGANLYLHSSGKVRFGQQSTGTQLVGSTTLSADTWYNIIVTKSGGTCTLYVNNSQEDQETDWIGLTGGNAILGASKDSGGSLDDFWSGLIDDFVVFDEVISSDKRAEIYNSGTGEEISNLSSLEGILAYYNMNSIDDGVVTNAACP